MSCYRLVKFSRKSVGKLYGYPGTRRLRKRRWRCHALLLDRQITVAAEVNQANVLSTRIEEVLQSHHTAAARPFCFSNQQRFNTFGALARCHDQGK